MRGWGAAVALLLVGLVAAGCGGTDEGERAEETERAEPAPATELPAAPAGQAWATAMGFAYLHPVDWQREARETGPGQQLLGFTGPRMTAEVTPQVGLGVGRDYPNTLEEAVRLSKASSRTRYSEYEIVEEGPVDVGGAEGYQIVATYRAFTEEPATVRAIDILVQTPQRVQANFFVRAAEEDFEGLGLQRLAASLRLAP